MEKTNDVAKATTKKIILTTPDRLRDIANEMERAQRMQATKGETSFIELTSTVTLAYDVDGAQ